MQLTSNSDKITRDYFDSLLIETRYLESCLPTTEMTLFGETFRTPIMTAALSHLHNTAQNGMTIYAQAAAQSGAVHWVGMGSDEELEEIVATGARTIKIIKPHADNHEVLRKIEHAVKVGCFAVGMDAYKCLALGAKAVSVGRHLKDILLKPEYTFQLQECACGEGAVRKRQTVQSVIDNKHL